MAPSVRGWASYSAAAVIASTLIPASNAWILDKSCDPYKDFVTAGMKDAFDLARAGKDVFDHLQPGSSGARAEAQKDIVSYLFRNTLTNGNIDRSNEDWLKAEKVFNEVLGFDTTDSGNPQSRPDSYKGDPKNRDNNMVNTIVVYCDLTRYKPGETCSGKKDKDRACDTSVGITDLIEDYSQCNKVSSMVNAWAGRSRKTPWLPSRIQICPAFLSHQQHARVSAWSGTGFYSRLARIGRTAWDALQRLPGQRAKIDLAMTFSGTMLHEMTHASASETDDVHENDSYFWKNVRKISDAAVAGKEGTRNADNYAYFGIAAKMISQKSSAGGQIQPMRPTADGQVEILDLSQAGSSSRNRKRDAAAVIENREGIYEVGYFSGGHMTETLPHGITVTVDGEVLKGTLYPHLETESAKVGGSGTSSKSASQSSKQGGNPSSSNHGGSHASNSKESDHSNSKTGSQASSTKPADVQPHTTSASTTGAPPVVASMHMTKGGKTTVVSYTSTKTSKHGAAPTSVWHCIGPLCDKNCLDPLDPKCKSSGGACCGWHPDPKLPPLPPPPPPPSDPDNGSHESDSPRKPSLDPSKAKHRTKSATKSDHRSTTKGETCTKTTKTACKTSVSAMAGQDGKKTTSTFKYGCSSITACSAKLSGSATTTTASSVFTADVFADPLDMAWLDGQESILALLAADTADPLMTFGKATRTTTAKSSAKATGKNNSSRSQKPTSHTTMKTTTKPKASSSAGLPQCMADGAPWYSPTSWCDCGPSATYATLPAEPGVKTVNCAYSSLPYSQITPKQTSSKPTTKPGQGGIGQCHASPAVPGTSAYCGCNGTPAVTLKPTKGQNINCGYTVMPTKSWDPVVPVTTTSKLTYATGNCGVHVMEVLGVDPDVGLIVTIKDGNNKKIQEVHKGMAWGDAFSVDSALPLPLKVTAVKYPKSKDKRMVAPPPPPPPPPEDGPVEFSYGSQIWEASDGQCSLGKWNNGDFGDYLNSLFGD